MDYVIYGIGLRYLQMLMTDVLCGIGCEFKIAKCGFKIAKCGFKMAKCGFK